MIFRFTKSSYMYEITSHILHEVILCIGYLCVLNSDNQTSLQCGSSPNLLQRLLSLPFEYFSYCPLTDILYPTLIACCYKHSLNTSVLESELSPSILANYIEVSYITYIVVYFLLLLFVVLLSV
ncbi:unnamed protein product [Schistosoma mattheei]|uniref:Uncharacterized protein n=1 Tax=Schistosoma mattheei TaxID=31246 RepID=A0A183Q796_9TREM|nr:unnamed protein product [Schistosoma mattheei]